MELHSIDLCKNTKCSFYKWNFKGFFNKLYSGFFLTGITAVQCASL